MNAQRAETFSAPIELDLAALERQVLQQDQRLAARGLQIWVGAEPTFTNRFSEAREWLCEALGEEKEERARRLLELLRQRAPGAAILRTLGRQYGGESLPRWSYGLYARRDGVPVWEGPPDPLGERTGEPCPPDALKRLQRALLDALRAGGWAAAPVEPAPDEADGVRVVFRIDGLEPTSLRRAEPLLGRVSIHERPIPAAGLRDELAERGLYLIVLREGAAAIQVELPAFSEVPTFSKTLRALAQAANRERVPSLISSGFPPPVDPSVLHTTLTPDPGVLEINQAPASDLTSFLRWNRELYALARDVGLEPRRLHYNGIVTDSGGGGQLTFGGPRPAESPFFAVPQLLPRLVRYLLRHPSLSYWLAPQYLGSGSQSPRPDEGLAESFRELGVALEQLSRVAAPSPELLWASLQHFLRDCSGNPHRSELNIEKLHNPQLPGRGRLGLVEFRALRMPGSAERLTAIALLLRALLALLAEHDPVPELVSWGPVLHDRFALPTLLQQDLREVLADLEAAGWGLGAEVERELLEGKARHIGTFELGEGRVDVTQALEFWPLLGDAAAQDAGGARLVDASTMRFEVRLSASGAAPLQMDDWQLLADGFTLPLVDATGPGGSCRVFGVRFRNFAPARGLHPSIAAKSRIVFELRRRSDGALARATWHAWRPDGSAYPGLPRDAEDAARRRAERFVIQRGALDLAPPARLAPASALTPYCLDLRRV